MSELLSKTYNKIYCIDTNIILNEASNIDLLSQDGTNLIVIPETVLDETDKFKSGLEEINFQARQFQRKLQDAEIIENRKVEKLNFISINLGEESLIDIHLISKEVYVADELNIDKKIINDRKILEIAQDVKREYNLEVIFVSLDIMARTRALSLGLQTETLKIDKDLDNYSINFTHSCEIENYHNVDDLPEIESHISNIEVNDPITGKKTYLYKTGSSWQLLDDKNTKRLWCTPRNRGQRVMTELILDDTNDLIICSGPAGTGKNFISLGAICKLMDLHKAKYNKIIYIRKTIISGNKDDELGFLPGGLDEKMLGYMQPMENSIESLLTNKVKKKISKEELENQVKKFKEVYDIEYVYGGHLRGQTFPKGSIIILDEAQNWDRSTMKTILSRVGEDNKVIIMGSNNQIDATYLGKSNNALTFMMNQCGKENSSDVIIQGVNLTNVVRSKVAEWADIAFDRD